MKTSKFFVAAMMVAAVAVGFTACNKDDKEPSDPFNPGKTDQPENPSGDRDGSEAKPYNVQNLLDMKANNTLPEKGAGTAKYWVEAYIIGSYNFNNEPKWIIGVENAETANVLLADDAASTNTYNVATVKLGDYASVLNLQANPANLGKKLKVYGVVEKYCGVGGIVNIEKALLDGVAVELPGTDDAEVSDNMTVAEAFAAAQGLKAGATTSKEAGVIGYVCAIKYAYSTKYSNITFYMSDDATKTTGKDGEDFLAFCVKGDCAKSLKVGDKVKVVAKLTNYKGNTPETVKGGSVELVK